MGADYIGDDHLSSANQTCEVLGPVGDVVLHGQNLEQIPPLHRQKQRARQVQAQVVLQVVGFVLEESDLLL